MGGHGNATTELTAATTAKIPDSSATVFSKNFHEPPVGRSGGDQSAIFERLGYRRRGENRGNPAGSPTEAGVTWAGFVRRGSSRAIEGTSIASTPTKIVAILVKIVSISVKIAAVLVKIVSISVKIVAVLIKIAAVSVKIVAISVGISAVPVKITAILVDAGVVVVGVVTISVEAATVLGWMFRILAVARESDGRQGCRNRTFSQNASPPCRQGRTAPGLLPLVPKLRVCSFVRIF